ncbi:MAG: fructose-1,6-bisphosphatase [Lachnospiraceae bacterium]|nr:fructose-1,6-bisphosphatase [Lachnospiraceae bacterium]
MKDNQLSRYYGVLAKQYPNVTAAATEIINLKAILNLPKGTEHFITDVHGEYPQFQHILRNASGAIRRKIDDEFGTELMTNEKKELAALIYYPKEKLDQVTKKFKEGSYEGDLGEWYKITIHRLIRVCKNAASKYTRSKVRKSMDPDFAYVMEELLTGRIDVADQEAYYNEIINSAISTGRAKELIVAVANLIRRLTVDHLHVVGDIYDRGPSPHLIIDALMRHHSVDIQWGNHDLLWMGAAAGNEACICNAIRIAAKYCNLHTLEEGYGINLLPLAKLAMEYYHDDPCACFELSGTSSCASESGIDHSGHLHLDDELEQKMHKAITILQFKVEGQLILNHPEYHMEDRLLLDKMDLENGTVEVYGKKYKLNDTYFPTISSNKSAYDLTDAETEVIEQLVYSFTNCEKLQQHMNFLYSHGALYKVYNGNLLYHGCVPLTKDGDFMPVELDGTVYKGKKLFDVLDTFARQAFYSENQKERDRGRDILWWLWENPSSPVFGKDKMATFERYFVSEKKTHVEPKNPYYSMLDDEAIVDKILVEFGLGEMSEDGKTIKPNQESHIINGHIPVEAKSGESPVKCDGKLLIIDGGLSKAYQPKTGIAGYTLIYNSYGLVLAAHEPFTSVEEAVEQGMDIHSDRILVQKVLKRKMVSDTDTGKELQGMVDDLQGLLLAYRSGVIKEKF